MQRGDELTGFAPGERMDALSIGALFNQLNTAIARAFPRGPGIWVRGEVQKIEEHRSGHCYIDLVDHDSSAIRDRPVLKVNCWRTAWGPIKAVLAGQGITLAVGMVVTLRGRVELYAPRAQVNLIASEIDVASLLGRMAAQRAALLAALESEGLLGRNKTVPPPDLPLRVGLVASPRTEGYADFLGQLESSGLAFSVILVPVQVQGGRAPLAIARALDRLASASCDVTVLVRGGGAKGDLVAFDAEPVARAIATHPRPVWTGIGHTGDQSVADIVAQRSFITPTECGQELVRRVRSWWEHVERRAFAVSRRSTEVVARAEDRTSVARSHLGRSARHQIDGHADRLRTAMVRIAGNTHRQLDAASGSIERRATLIGTHARVVVARQEDRTSSWRRLMAAYDVDRQLERGYTLTTNAAGHIVRTAAALSVGQRIVTRFADGSASSTVEGTEGRRGLTKEQR